jgi:hypothetical protein
MEKKTQTKPPQLQPFENFFQRWPKTCTKQKIAPPTNCVGKSGYPLVED